MDPIATPQNLTFTTPPVPVEKFIDALCTERDWYMAKTNDRPKLLTVQKLFKSVFNFRNIIQSTDEPNTWFLRFTTDSDFAFNQLLDDMYKNKTGFTVKYVTGGNSLTDSQTSVYRVTWRGMKLKVIWDKN
jgi:hypothetical protein